MVSGADLVMARSVPPPTTTVVGSLAWSFAGFGSGAVPLTVTVFVTTPGVVAVATTVIVAVAPAVLPGIVQTIVDPALQTPDEGAAETNVSPAGSVSLTVASLVAGP